jgi:2,3-bisphosphoglycerate-independent phosphoglycerate mutase
MLGGEHVKFHTGVSYRHLMTFKGDIDVQTTPPHDILSKPVQQFLPTGKGADLLRTIIDRSQAIMGTHEINTVRRDLGENPATSVWLWGQGRMPQLPNFRSRYGVIAAAITAVDLIRGLARLIGWTNIEVQGATGYIDTNYAGKGAAAVAALDTHDLVLVHVEAPDEASHIGNVDAKVQAIASIDQHVVGPVLERLQKEGDDWRILVLPDHPTPCAIRTHTDAPVPFAIAGKRIESVVGKVFTEDQAASGDMHIDPGHELMEYFLTVR